MRNEGKIAIVLVCLMVAVAAVYFFKSGNEKPINLTVGHSQTDKSSRKVDVNEELPLGVDFGIETSAEKQAKQENAEKEKTERAAQSQPVISAIKVDSSSEKPKISIDLGAPASQPASCPAETEARANKPVKIELDLKENESTLAEGIAEGQRNEDECEKIVYVVKPGDTLYDISEKYYGRGELWTIIAQANPLINPDKLLVGQKIIIPPKGQAENKYDAAALNLPDDVDVSELRAYKVKAGESFYTIARDELGKASRWREIFRINKKLVKGKPERLKAGQVIYLPKE